MGITLGKHPLGEEDAGNVSAFILLLGSARQTCLEEIPALPCHKRVNSTLTDHGKALEDGVASSILSTWENAAKGHKYLISFIPN